jgi:trimeric autotransporter adhesin
MKIIIPYSIFNSGGILSFIIFNLIALACHAQPVNDLCANATLITENSTCTNLNLQTLKSATATPGAPGTCGNASSADVWYKFVPTTNYPVITISTLGSSLKGAAPVIEMLSGTCAGLVPMGCVTGSTTATSLAFNTSTAVGGAGLTIGNTYMIRIYTNTNTGTPAGNNWGFSICVAAESNLSATVDYGKSYVNITKGVSGGTTEPGDTLEIRATFVVRTNTAYNSSFTDNIPANTTYIPGTLRVLTNEGKIYQQFTDAADGDAGTLSGTAVEINLGAGANQTIGGTVTNTSKPSFYGSTCIMVASYRVQVKNAISYGTALPVGYGQFSYTNSAGTVSIILFPADTIIAYKNYGICANTVGSNAIISEFGGTFGTGNIKDRTPSSKVPASYTYSVFSSTLGMPNDYYYGVSNNTSGGTTAALGYSTLNTWAYPDNSQTPSHRIFSVWDIIGDHTGATNPLLGNPATDDNNNVTGGYMVVINSSYRTDTAYLDTVYNLCPSTYYQYTAWFRNMCSKCGCDSNGTGATGGSTYIPTGMGDSSGVHPNLTFNINGYDYYTTGNMNYTGQWAQKGFTYLTGPTQTSMVINVRNNAPGGGGNDWAIDDIGVATCSPNMILTPDKPDTLCIGADDTVRFQVNSFFNNYTQWQLQQSTDGGTTWSAPGNDTTGQGASGSSIPVFDSLANQYEYTVARYYRLIAVDTSILYRITVASTPSNLSNTNCAFNTTTPKLVKGVNCMLALPADFISFKGRLQDGEAALQWIVSNEMTGTTYIVERSSDQVNFIAVASIEGSGQAARSTYAYTDQKNVDGLIYYRVRMVFNGLYKYSSIVMLSNSTIGFDISSVVNPFNDFITLQLNAPEDGTATFVLLDMFGRTMKREKQAVGEGLNTIRINDLGSIPSATYTLLVYYKNNLQATKVIKLLR